MEDISVVLNFLNFFLITEIHIKVKLLHLNITYKSNRRHFIRNTFAERKGDIGKRESLVLLLLVHFPKGNSSQGWAEQELWGSSFF